MAENCLVVTVKKSHGVVMVTIMDPSGKKTLKTVHWSEDQTPPHQMCQIEKNEQ